MGNMAVWKILEEMAILLRQKEVEIPHSVINDLRSAKSMIKTSETLQGDGELFQKIDECLGIVEEYLTSQAQKTLGPETVDKWLRSLEQARCETCQTQTAESKFISGVPKQEKWLRIEPIQNLPAEKLKQLAQEQNLSIKTQENGKLLVHGESEDIKEFVKKMTSHATKK